MYPPKKVNEGQERGRVQDMQRPKAQRGEHFLVRQLSAHLRNVAHDSGEVTIRFSRPHGKGG